MLSSPALPSPVQLRPRRWARVPTSPEALIHGVEAPGPNALPVALQSFSASLPSPAALARRRVLVVDNEPASTRLVRLTLERSGLFEVCEVNDPFLALATTRKFQPHLVLLDIEMPGLDGSRVAEQMRAEGAFRHLPILFMTSLITPEEAERHLYTAGNRVLAKPVTISKLMQAVAEMLGNLLPGERSKV